MELQKLGDSGKFSLGKTFTTQAALAELGCEEMLAALKRHAACDWGDLGASDKARNNEALKSGERLFSLYHSCRGIRFYIITEWDRSVTTVLLPNEY